MARGSNWKCLLPEAPTPVQEPGLHGQPGQHLRAGVRGVRQGAHARQATELHVPVPAGHQETNEEIRPPCPSVCLYFTKFIPEVLISR